MIAWQIAVDATATEEALLIAYEAADRATIEESKLGAYWDTLATINYRMGDYWTAIQIERQALQFSDDAFTASQLSRFIRAQNDGSGAALIGGECRVDDIQITIEPSEGDNGSRRNGRLALEDTFERGVEIYGHVVSRGSDVGLIRVTLGADHESAYTFYSGASGALGTVPPGAHVEIALVDATGSEIESGGFSWKYWPTDPSVLELP